MKSAKSRTSDDKPRFIIEFDMAEEHEVVASHSNVRSTESASFAESVQFHSLKDQPCCLTVRDDDGRSGQLILADGTVVWAKTAGGIAGFDAFVEFLTWNRVEVTRVESEVTEMPERNLEAELSQLLLDALWEADDREPTEMAAAKADSAGFYKMSETQSGVQNLQVLLHTSSALSAIEGFIFGFFIDETGRVIDRIGEEPDVPEWALETFNQIRKNPNARYSVTSTNRYIDACIPHSNIEGIGLYIRVDAEKTNPGMLQVSLRRFVREV